MVVRSTPTSPKPVTKMARKGSLEWTFPDVAGTLERGKRKFAASLLKGRIFLHVTLEHPSAASLYSEEQTLA